MALLLKDAYSSFLVNVLPFKMTLKRIRALLSSLVSDAYKLEYPYMLRYTDEQQYKVHTDDLMKISVA